MNSATDSLVTKTDLKLKVNNKGEVRYESPAIFKSICAIQIVEFPFDEQVCNLRFAR